MAVPASETTNLLSEAFVYLAAAVVVVPVAKRLGLGSALGYLAAGVLIGPFVLGLVGQEGEDVMHFAEFGVVLMLFLVGLEMEPRILWRARRSILGLGGSQVILTTAVIAGLLTWLGYALQPAIAIGMTLALSSTAMVLQTLTEKAWIKTLPGRRSFSVLLFQDIAVIPMLALMPLLGTGGGFADGGALGGGARPVWLDAILILGGITGLILAGRFLSLPIFRFIALTRSREVFIAAALVLVMGVSLVMQWLGLSPALGAFLAGVVLAKSDYRHELESNIEPFKGLLLGVFFIAVGATMDLALMVDQPLAIFGTVIALIALKFLILLALGRLFRLPWGDNYLFSFALAQGGEFAFLLFAFADRYGVLTPAEVNRWVLVVALSMMATPLLIIFYERYVRPRCAHGAATHDDEEHIEDQSEVIVAGFGRFGQVVARMLHGAGIGTTLLDDDASQIEQAGRFGYKVYYGDATRAEMLQAAGAEDARLLVVALDDRDLVEKTVGVARMHFPNLKILVRAYDRGHAYKLMQTGADFIVRETFGSALIMGEEALTLLGFPALRAHRITRTFKDHDEQAMAELYELWEHDPGKYQGEMQAKGADLARVLASDIEEDAEMEEEWRPPSDLRPAKAGGDSQS